MKIIVKAPLWAKILYACGICMLIAGVCSHFFGFPDIDPLNMPFFLIGGVALIIPYQAYYLGEVLKYRPKG